MKARCSLVDGHFEHLVYFGLGKLLKAIKLRLYTYTINPSVGSGKTLQ